MSSVASSGPLLVRGLRKIIRSIGFDVVRYGDNAPSGISPDYDSRIVETIRCVRPYTMTSPERIASLCEAVRYVARARIPGDIVECGVWRGGSMMAAARTLLEVGDRTRDLYLYDTFEGMPTPGDLDSTCDGTPANVLMREARRDDPSSIWCVAPLEAVKAAVLGVGYPEHRIRFVAGRVEETIPGTAPERIALLRLDTDWYESTRHELSHLFPRLSKGGVLIVDDYGHWQGARRAVDECIAASGARLLLNRVDYTARIAVKID